MSLVTQLVAVSSGLKRLIASGLNSLLGVLLVVPDAAAYIAPIQQIAGFFGLTGLVHAAGSGTVTKKKLASASALVSLLLAASYFVPAIAAYRTALESLAGVLGSAALGVQVNADKSNQ